MTAGLLSYHQRREQQCREMALAASDPDIRRRHEELADLHAARAAEDPANRHAEADAALETSSQ